MRQPHRCREPDHQRVRDPLVSVVIPTRNRCGLLKQAVASVQSQTFERWEGVVVDDFSTDDTRSWLRTVEDDRLRVLLLDEHEERSVARNRGLAIARGRFVMFLDDDDKLRRRALAHLVRALHRHQDAVAAVGARAVFDDRGHRRRARHPLVPLCRDLWPEALTGMFVGCQGQTLFRTEVVVGAGGWRPDLSVAEDHELWLRVTRRGPVALVPHTVLENRRHGGQSRPPGVATIEAEFRRAHVDSLPEGQRERGSLLLEARARLRRAMTAFAAGDCRVAIVALVAGIRRAPRLLGSPVVGPGLLILALKATAGAVMGPRFLQLVRSGRDRLRIISRTAPGATTPFGRS